MPALPETLDRSLAQLCERLLSAARDARKDFIKTRDEIARYAYDKDYSFLYQEMGDDLFFKAKVAKGAEFLEIMGPYLFPAVPDCAVNDEEGASPLLQARHKLEERYCDYSWKRGQLHEHGIRMTTEALLGGRGVLWTGYNERKKCVQSVYDTVDNLLIDPDARVPEDLNWVARRRVKPRWWLKQQYPDSAEKIDKMDATVDAPSRKRREGAGPTDLIEYHEIYTRVPLTNYAPGLMGKGEGERTEAELAGLFEQAEVKLCVTDKHILSISPWEIPLFMDDLWPVEWFDPIERPNCLWPVAPLETGLGHLKALNWIYTLYLSKMRVTTRTPLVVMTRNGQGLKDDQILKILKGKQLDIIKLTVNGEMMKLGDLVQQFKFDTGVEEFERFANIVGQAFEKATGLYEVLYTGTTPTQIRNATTADMIRNSSQSRVQNMAARMEAFMGRMARKTLLAGRFLEDPASMANRFGPEAGTLWGTLAPPEMVAQERQMREQTKQMIVQQGMMQAQMVPVMPGMMPPPPPDPAQLAAQAEQQIGPEQLVSMEEWLNDASRDIAAGSMRPMNPQAQIDNLNVAINQLVPAVISVPGGAEFAAATVREFGRLNRYSQEFQQACQNLFAAASAVTQAQVQAAIAPPMPAGSPEKGPKSGPEGGKPTVE